MGCNSTKNFKNGGTPISDSDKGNQNKKNQMNTQAIKAMDDSFVELFKITKSILEKAGSIKRNRIIKTEEIEKANIETANIAEFNHENVLNSNDFDQLLLAGRLNVNKMKKRFDIIKDSGKYKDEEINKKELNLRELLNSLTLIKL